ncbi:hypothetical protein FB561_2524 [Kribbella amoyensis]|uniref:Uncharacterized protein n=1 Tax=Kribbella amoyensis TaxID=996641 RepID=A0A561BRD9_9ACTN|nr:DUF4175 domain-containing protein [Kribbella amoyensis]TWD81409.1 hypothetical protein FB561_2524 [Kribbella amoyensis]
MRDVILLALAIGYPVVLLWQLRAGKLRDRADLILVLSIGALFLLFARSTADWTSLPTWPWLIGLALLVAATAWSGRIWPKLTWFGTTHPTRRGISTGLQLAVVTAVGLLLI